MAKNFKRGGGGGGGVRWSIDYKSHQKSLPYFSHFATFLFLLKNKATRRGPQHYGSFPKYAPVCDIFFFVHSLILFYYSCLDSYLYLSKERRVATLIETASIPVALQSQYTISERFISRRTKRRLGFDRHYALKIYPQKRKYSPTLSRQKVHLQN